MRTRVAATGQLSRFRSALDEISGCIAFTEIKPATVGLIYDGHTKDGHTKNLRTLDAIHLATLAHFNLGPGSTVLATYDRRLATAAQAMGFQVIAP